MGCGCKGGDTTKKTTTENEKEGISFMKYPKMVGGIFIGFIVAVILTPIMVVLLTIALYQGWFGDGFNLNDILDRFRDVNGSEESDDGEINPDDYEIVGVDKL